MSADAVGELPTPLLDSAQSLHRPRTADVSFNFRRRKRPPRVRGEKRSMKGLYAVAAIALGLIPTTQRYGLRGPTQRAEFTVREPWPY